MRQKLKNPVVIILLVIGVIALALGVFLIIDHFSRQFADEVVNITVDFSDDITKIDWSTYPEYELALTTSVEITNAGVYRITGEIADGNITINTDGNIKLEFSNVKIANSHGPAVFVANAKNVVLAAAEHTTNYFSDGTSYTGYETDEVGTIFSHDDLMLEGPGAFVITSNNEDAIVSKDDLVFNGGVYQITSADDGIRGKDSVVIQSGDFTIKSGGDGIKSTNTTEAERGFVYVMDGNFEIVAELDGIQAENALKISGGDFNIKTGSAKGMKGTNVLIEAGTFTFDCSDDALHSNGDLKIISGKFRITTGDDGIHADDDLVIDGGEINITRSYEGIEGQTVTINDGDIDIIASDDGINAAGGSDASSMNRPGANKFSADSDAIITLRGGKIKIQSSGDSIDSNGSIYIEGGEVTIIGPTNGADNALDHDGELVITGGTILASEVTGMMAGGISSSSTNYSVIINFKTAYNAGTKVALEDASGNVLFDFSPATTFNSITFSSPELVSGQTYTVKVDGATYQSFTLSSTITTVGLSSGMMGPGGTPSGGKPSGTRR